MEKAELLKSLLEARVKYVNVTDEALIEERNNLDKHISRLKAELGM